MTNHYTDVCESTVAELRAKNDILRQQVTLLREFVTKVSAQLPEKPDHWSSCSQCEHNSSDAQDIIEALAAKEEDCDEFQSDVQAAAGGLSQTPL